MQIHAMTYPSRLSRACVLSLAMLLPMALPAQSRKKEAPDPTQTLEALPDPPASLPADSARLSFLSSPLTAKGKFSQQTRDALKALLAQAKGAQILRLRAYAAGSGDLRRVPQLVAEVFTEKKLPLPVVTVLQVGALDLDGALIQFQATLQDRRALNPQGLALLSAQLEQQPRGAAPVATLLGRSSDRLSRHLRSLGLAPADLVEATCFVSSLDQSADLHQLLAAQWPRIPVTLVQTQRSPTSAHAACSAAARLRKAPAAELEFAPGEDEAHPAATLVRSSRLLVTGAQLAFRYQEDDARLAFERLERTLQSQRASLKDAAVLLAWPLSPQLAALIERVQPAFLDNRRRPAGAVLPIEGLPGLDASFALEAIVLAASSSQN